MNIKVRWPEKGQLEQGQIAWLIDPRGCPPERISICCVSEDGNTVLINRASGRFVGRCFRFYKWIIAHETYQYEQAKPLEGAGIAIEETS